MEFDRLSMSSMGSRQHTFERPGSDIKKTGYLKKMKTGKKKFFVLRSTSSSGPARLEYYDSEKKFKSSQPPKRCIHLHTCFNINKKSDSRHGKHGIVLYTNEECFTVLTESEDDQEAWLSIMLEFQNEYLPDGDMHKEHYEHVWQVTLQPRGLGQGKGTKGQYRLCLNTSTLSLVKANSTQPQYAIQLVTIRSVAHNECSFRLEVGKVAPTGEGEFWFIVEDASIAKDMHEVLLHYMNTVKDPSFRKDQQASQFRQRKGSQSSIDRRWPNKQDPSRPASYYPPSTVWPTDINSPSSPNYPSPHDHIQGSHRPRSNTAESRASRASSHSYHDDGEFMIGYNGDQQEHISYVPEDMSPPPSPGGLDEEMSAYLQMDMEKNRLSGATTASVTPPSAPSSYFTMSMPSHGHGQKGEVSPSMPEAPSVGYMSMHPHHPPPPSHISAPIPIHTHSFSEPHHTHSTPLPTVREGGSNEGYLPMDIPNSPASSTGVLRPDPAKCMLSDDNTGLPPRTYSLGSKPVTKKYPGYIEMGPRKGTVGNDMSRATSAPHIINKGRREREHTTDSPTPSASSLSTSIKSDDSDSFMEYMPMRPRTASDSFNYRPRTSSFGKLQQTCRPRSSSHGQGTRPFTKFSKLSVEQARISQDPLQRTSRESSLHGSFDSLRVSNESLRRMSQEMRQPSGSNASDYAEMRGTPSPQMKNMKSEPDGYVNMQVGPSGRKSSPHRMRTDSSGSGRRPDIASSSSERLHQQPHLQQIDDYTEMAPLHASGGSGGDSYMNMDYGPGSRHSFSSDTKSLSSTSSLQSSRPTDYMSMDMDKNKKSDAGRSLSMENVDTYVIYDPSQGANKPRTGSLGSKDKKISRPGSARKSSSASMSSASPSNSGTIHPSASTSTRTGGSSDSIRKAARQSSMEKYGSLGKDFRKKSGSTGSRPSSVKGAFGVALGKDQHVGSGIMPMRKGATSKTTIDEPTDEYIEFSPTACIGDSDPNNGHLGSSHSAVPISNSGRSGPFASSGSFGTGRSPNPTPSPLDEEDYTPYNPAPSSSSSSSSRAVHFQTHQQPQHLPPSSHSHHHPQHHHSPSQTKSGHSSFPYSTQPSSSAQTKQVAAKDVPEYVGFVPGVIPSSSSAPPATSSSHIKQVEAKDVPEYVGFEPGNIPSSTVSTTVASQSRPTPPQDMAEYVGYQPGIISQQSAPQTAQPKITYKIVSPNSAVSYIQSSTSTQPSGSYKQKHSGMKQQYSTGSSPRSPSNNSLNSENPRRGSSPVPLGRPKSPLAPVMSSSVTTAQTAAPKPVEVDTSEYLSYSPAVPALSTNTLKENTEPGPVPAKTVSLIQGSVTQAPPPFMQLSVDVGGSESHEPRSPQGSGSGNANSSSGGIAESGGGNHQRQQTEMTVTAVEATKIRPGYDRQRSAPSAPTFQSGPYGKNSPIIQESQLQQSSPQSMSPSPNTDNLGSSRKKHFSGSSVTESPSPTGFGPRQKHWSGSSNSSMKSRKVSSDSEKSTPKGSKSDSNTSLNSTGSRKKGRISSGERSSGSSAEKSPLSPSRCSGDVFCPSSGKALEAKMVPVTAKIRHSLGDMTSVVGVVNKDVQSHHGLSRPGSTPCMQNLDPCPDQGSRSAGDTPSPGSLQFPGGPRSRHSLSDLGSYSPMNVASPGLATVSSESGNNSASASNRNSSGGSNSGSGESCGSGTDLPPKPLNYVRLDLSCSEGQGDADGKSPRVKSRNSSDADEKQPPLSYAEIDFVRSQNYNRTLAMGNAGDNNSSKS